MRLPPVLTLALFLGVGLAGCSASDDPQAQACAPGFTAAPTSGTEASGSGCIACPQKAADGGDCTQDPSCDTDPQPSCQGPDDNATGPGPGSDGNGTSTPTNSTGPQNVTFGESPNGWNWSGPSAASIRPGVQTVTGNGQCTSNFVFSTPTDLYIGQAAHCSGGGAATQTDGCRAPPGRLNLTVEIEGASKPGTLVYSSWFTMQERQESDSQTCAYNDFALVRLDPADHDKVHPAMRFYGGPEGIQDPEEVRQRDKVLTFGNSGLRQGISTLMPREGYVMGAGGGWTTTVLTTIPGVPGDSGSAVIMGDGPALGILVTVSATGMNGVTSLQHALAYAQQHSGIEGLQLETWEQITDGDLPA